MRNIDLVGYIDKLTDKIQAENGMEWAHNINAWDWNPGVGLMGVVRAAEITDRDRYVDFLKDWFDRNAENRWFGSVNNVAPANVPLYLSKKFDGSVYENIAGEYFNWCVNESVRTSNNGFGHVWVDRISGTKGLDDYKNQLWVDSIYMTCIFLIKYGLCFGSDEAVRLGLEQARIHSECLFCEADDLIFHAYHCIDKKTLGRHWGRGNGWFVVTLAEIIANLAGSVYDTEYFKGVFKRIMKKALSLSETDGMLHTLIDVKASYKETTAGLLFGYAALRGVECGELGAEYTAWADRIIETVAKMLDHNGMRLLNCSGGTGPGENRDYMEVPFSDTVYANGLAIQLFAQRMLIE